MHHDPNRQREILAERDRYIVLLHLSTFSDAPGVESWTADRVIRDLGFSPQEAESVLISLLRAGYLRNAGVWGGLTLTSHGTDYLERKAGRRRSVRISASPARKPATESPPTVEEAQRDRDLNRELRERLQYSVLFWLRDQVGTDCRKVVSALGLARRLGHSTKDIYAAIECLARHGLIGYHGAGPRICLTQDGLRQLDRARRRRSIRIKQNGADQSARDQGERE